MIFTYNHGPVQPAFEAWATSLEPVITKAYESLSAEEKKDFDSLEDFASAIYFDMSDATLATYLEMMA